MANEKVARLSSGIVKFYPLGENGEIGDEIILGFNQSVSLNRSFESKELLSNDEGLGQSAFEVETKVTYEFNASIADLSLKNLSLAFKGLVEQKSYVVNDIFINGRKLLDGSANVTGKIGDGVLKDNKIYILTDNASNKPFSSLSLAPRVYSATMSKLNAEMANSNFGRIVVEGINLATNKPQILVIPKVNLKCEGDFSVVSDDFVKLSLKGKALKTANEPIFSIIDAGEAK